MFLSWAGTHLKMVPSSSSLPGIEHSGAPPCPPPRVLLTSPVPLMHHRCPPPPLFAGAAVVNPEAQEAIRDVWWTDESVAHVSPAHPERGLHSVSTHYDPTRRPKWLFTSAVGGFINKPHVLSERKCVSSNYRRTPSLTVMSIAGKKWCPGVKYHKKIKASRPLMTLNACYRSGCIDLQLWLSFTQYLSLIVAHLFIEGLFAGVSEVSWYLCFLKEARFCRCQTCFHLFDDHICNPRSFWLDNRCFTVLKRRNFTVVGKMEQNHSVRSKL